MKGRTVWRASFALAAVASCAPLGASAQPRVIPPGHEREIQRLFEPHVLGGEVRDDWRLWSIAIAPDAIRVDVRRGDATARMRFTPRRAGEPRGERTASFDVSRETRPGAEAALDALSSAVRRNDRGQFWTRVANVPPAHDPHYGWTTDGTLLGLAGLVLMLFLSVRVIRGEPPERARRIALTLGAIVVAGAVLRVAISPDTVLEAGPYSRYNAAADAVAHGPLLALVSRVLGLRFALQETMSWADWAFASMTPIVVFLQARALHRDATVALVSAALLAVLPLHLRFSCSDSAFVPSLVMSCLADVLIHVASEDRSRAVRVGATFVLPPLVFAMLTMRPLNVLFIALFVLHALFFVAPETPRVRRAIVIGLVAGAGALGVVLHLLPHYAVKVSHGLSWNVIATGVAALVSPKYDTLIHPWITPPLLPALALGGAVWLWRRSRARVLYLVAWFLAFFIAHAYFLPEEISFQARYHLQVVLPVVFLAAPALVALVAYRPLLGGIAAGVLALSPLVHLDFVRDVSFDATREHAFLRALRPRIPRGCTVVEYVPPSIHLSEARMFRIGRVLDDGKRVDTWQTRAVRDGPAAIVALSDDRHCAVWIQSLLCFARKRPSEPIAPACAEVRRAFELETLAERRFRHRAYDGTLAAGFRGARDQRVTLAALRVVGPRRTQSPAR